MSQPRFPIGIAHLTALEVPPLDLVMLASRIGYATIGLRMFAAFPGAIVYELSPGSAALREMQQRLDGEGVQLYDVETITIDAAFDPQSIRPVLESAAALGARRVTVSGEDPDRARLTAKFVATCDVAHEFGLAVDMENMAWRPLKSFAEAVALVQAAGRPNGGVLVDALHLIRNGGAAADIAATSSALIRSVQLCDAPAKGPATTEDCLTEARTDRLPPGAGGLPLAAIARAIPADAVVSVEVPLNQQMPPFERLKLVFDATQKTLAQARGGNA